MLPGIGQHRAIAGGLPGKKHIHQISQRIQSFAGGSADVQDVHKRKFTGLYGLTQIGFVDQCDGIFTIGAQIDHRPVLLGQRLRAVAHKNHQLGLLGSLLGSLHTHGFDPVAGLTDTGGVDELHPCGANHHRFLHGISGGARNLGDDHPLKACQRVQQAGLAHIGLAQNGGPDTLAQNRTLSVSIQKRLEGFGVTVKAGLISIQTEILNIFIRVIQYRMKVAAQIGQFIINRF